MNVPPGHTEASVLEAIERVVGVLAPSFVFGYFDLDDIKQFARLKALEVLASGKYDPARPLANFLYAHIQNRLINLHRDKLRRTDSPCPRCYGGDFCGPDGMPCQPYENWARRNTTKASLMRPLDLDNIADEHEPRTRTPSTVVEEVEIAEILRKIDEELPVEYRQTYLQMRAGVSVPKARRVQVERAVREICRGALCPSGDD